VTVDRIPELSPRRGAVLYGAVMTLWIVGFAATERPLPAVVVVALLLLPAALHFGLGYVVREARANLRHNPLQTFSAVLTTTLALFLLSLALLLNATTRQFGETLETSVDVLVILRAAGFIVVAVGLAWFFELQATTTIIFVRHADTETPPVAHRDPSLNERGRLRAELLADVLENIDVVAGVDAIYASEFRSTQETAEPLARRLDLEIKVADPYQVDTFTDRVKRDYKGKIVLVVTHADLVAPLIASLSGSKNVPVIAESEYDNIYIVTIPWFGKVKTLRLHYGLPWPVPESIPSSGRLPQSL
jgi:2,3-bisphosphoglycerate-dependent phosphoglycerate mutase